jgi:protein subunit release factor A
MEIPEHIFKGLKKTIGDPNEQKGGQSVGLCSGKVTLTHEELGFSITVELSRSQIRNYNFAITVFELYLQEMKII